jgi:phosphoribosylformylglycinamidine synthase
MTPYEMMLSESQERMLMVLKPGREAEAEAIFHKWELDFAVIGKVTDTGRLVLKYNGETAADIPLGPLGDDAPCYERPWVRTEPPAPLADVPESTDIAADLLKLMASPDLASRRWIWEQYDQKVGADTVQPPGGDAAVVRIHGTRKALAIATDCTPRYCFADPYEGGKQAIAETWRNLCAVGARPLAATDCMNFGNPQRPEIMGQFVGCIEGMAEACRALDFPIVSGNVSLYNETKADDGSGSAILPTPAIGGVGLIEDWEKAATIGFKAEGETIVLIGIPPANREWLEGGDPRGSARLTGEEYARCLATGRFANWGRHLGQSLWLREIVGREEGPPPQVDLERERAAGEFVRRLIEQQTVTAVHDVSDGGVAVAIAEMALAGGIGARVQTYGDHRLDYFCEDQGRYLVTVAGGVEAFATLLENAKDSGVQIEGIGETGDDTLRFFGDQDNLVGSVSLDRLRRAHEGFFSNLMGADAALA